MKKVLSLLTSMIAIAVLFTACSKSTDKILTKKDGKWDLELLYEEKLNGTVVDTDSDKGSITFTDNKFTMTIGTEDPETGTWSATDEKVILTTSQGFGVSFDIIESKKNSQTWEYVITDNDGGDITIEKTTLKLTR